MGNTPNIRFKGFTDDWEQRKLNEVAEFNPKSELPDEFEYVDLESVVGTEMISHRTETKDSAPSRAQRLAQPGDVFFQTVRPYQKNNYLFSKLDNNYVFSTGYAQMRPNIDTAFLMSFLQTDSFVKIVLDNCTGTSYPAINSSDLSNLEISLPKSFEEQKKVGKTIISIDNLITLHQRKCDETKKLKKFMLQKMFPKKDAKKPEIRFAGFTNDWEQRKLNEVAEFNPKSELPDEFEYVDLESVVGTEMISHRTETKDSAPSRAQRLAQPGDVFFQTVRPYQKNNYLFSKLDNNYVFSTGYAQMRPNIDTAFLMSFLQTDSFVKIVLDNCTGTSYPAINSSDLSNLEISLPKSFEEQKKVGKTIISIDNLITLHQRKCDETKKLKKFMLQKMFPKKDAKKPEIRFAGFTNDWEQRKFGDVGSVAMCKRIFKEQTSDEGEVPFYKIGTFGGEPDAFISRKLFDEYKTKYPYPHKGDILISASGSIGRTIEFTGKDEYFQDSNIVWLKHENEIDNNFLKVLYSIVEWSCEGSTIKRLYNDNFLKTEFMLPQIDEQIKLGDYFANLDNLITLHQRKCDELKEFKKYMLQNMFPQKG